MGNGETKNVAKCRQSVGGGGGTHERAEEKTGGAPASWGRKGKRGERYHYSCSSAKTVAENEKLAFFKAPEDDHERRGQKMKLCQESRIRERFPSAYCPTPQQKKKKRWGPWLNPQKPKGGWGKTVDSSGHGTDKRNPCVRPLSVKGVPKKGVWGLFGNTSKKEWVTRGEREGGKHGERHQVDASFAPRNKQLAAIVGKQEELQKREEEEKK